MPKGNPGVKRGPQTPEHRAKLSAAQKGRTLTEEHRAKLRAAAQNRSPEVRAHMGAHRKGTHHSEETKARIAASHRGKTFTDERKARISAALKESESHQARVAGGIHRTHGEAAKNAGGTKYTPAYRAWCAMRQRVYNAKLPTWNHYGGRGITVCARWDPKQGGTFQNFLEDMGPRPDWATGGLDRINGLLGYEPSNCRWATVETQMANRRCANCVASEALIFLLLRERAQLGLFF